MESFGYYANGKKITVKIENAYSVVSYNAIPSFFVEVHQECRKRKYDEIATDLETMDISAEQSGQT
jgi:hypothetical protein